MRRSLWLLVLGGLSLACALLPDSAGRTDPQPAPALAPRPFLRPEAPPPAPALTPVEAQGLYCVATLLGALALCLALFTYLNSGRI